MTFYQWISNNIGKWWQAFSESTGAQMAVGMFVGLPLTAGIGLWAVVYFVALFSWGIGRIVYLRWKEDQEELANQLWHELTYQLTFRGRIIRWD